MRLICSKWTTEIVVWLSAKETSTQNSCSCIDLMEAQAATMGSRRVLSTCKIETMVSQVLFPMLVTTLIQEHKALLLKEPIVTGPNNRRSNMLKLNQEMLCPKCLKSSLKISKILSPTMKTIPTCILPSHCNPTIAERAEKNSPKLVDRHNLKCQRKAIIAKKRRRRHQTTWRICHRINIKLD